MTADVKSPLAVLLARGTEDMIETFNSMVSYHGKLDDPDNEQGPQEEREAKVYERFRVKLDAAISLALERFILRLDAARAEQAAHRQEHAVVCRGSWVLGTACGHCSRCAAELPKAMEYFRDKAAVLEGRLRLVIQMIPPPSGMGDYADSVKVHLFEALRAQLYDEKGNLR
jgi:hypothetical protein